MMNTISNILLASIILILGIILSSCSTEIGTRSKIIFMDIPSAQKVISQDTAEHFFSKIGLKDIQLQLKNDSLGSLDSAKELYQNKLKESVLKFNENDRKRLNIICNEVEKSLLQINPNIWSDSIQLIKIKPDLYGESVFYTRDQAIVIPSNMLRDYDKSILKQIIIHEIFHIYSRNNRGKKRAALYELIYFKKLKKELFIEEELKQKVLLNPDGLEMEWYIEIIVDEKKQKLIPLLVAIESKENSDFYFDNLELRFFPIQKSKDSLIIQNEPYYKEEDLIDLYNHITHNTNYIIHPDEILAENFVLAVLSQENPAILKGLSEEGRDLVEKLRLLLKS